MSRIAVEKAILWGHDPHGIEERIWTHNICYEAFEHQLRLSDAEKKVLVNRKLLCSRHNGVLYVFSFRFFFFFFFHRS
ncbi:uncharacterized protein EURHEDRAFT_366922 [Aspergillus ruber CBS 135680]|uniref:Uncharacterized protein n=1 Tax=Aspergillus ruber (strain CBS 135680) TaxID=1388766 RepID=A0A017SHJ2_ASPRC|nr:uncharacterized protein EURHEDRAFT_366922 [Aspergillus ruber CBS 135680]EYE96226.1 hypothetical protein EURHEDRAFT_366922 [Aspergillus ruber CBS 135680]